MDVINKIVYLYGDAKIDYGKISLTAQEVEINWNTNIVTARPGLDSTGKKIGAPIFKDAESVYQIENEIKYNFKTKKGIISGIVTQQGEGYIHGNTVKKVDEDLYIKRAKYTTCNLAHPHFYINAHKLKVIPDDKIVSGPFNLVISDIPTPLGFFLGFFPMPKKEKSGFIIPTGGGSTRGFFLREGGYYWAVNEYLGLKLVGDGYANGSFRTNFNGEYRKRYAFSGSLNLNYSQIKNSFNENEGFSQDINIAWVHSTQRKRNSNLTANVNAGTSNYFKRNSYNPSTFQQGVFSSSINYYKNFANSPFSMNVALRQDQNVNTGVMNFTLPDVTLSMNRIYPLRRKNVAGNKRFYENLNMSYTLNSKIFITNDSVRLQTDKVLPFNGKNLNTLLSKADIGAKHTIPIAMPLKANKTFLRFFTLTPSATYEEYWYRDKLKYNWQASDSTLNIDTIRGFTRTYSYSTSVSMSTNIYGRIDLKGKILQAIRHTFIPTFSFNYRPDFSDPGFGNYQEVQIDEFGNKRKLSNYSGFVYGAPGAGKVSSLAFNFMNVFEAKVRSKKDTITGTKKIKLIDQLSLSGNYNFAAESNNLSLINASARTRILVFDIFTSAIFDPYIFRDSIGSTSSNLGRLYSFRTSEYAASNGQGLARLTTYNISIGTKLNPKANKKKVNQPRDNSFD
ncbi:MAG: LPS-assembly protein LptD, partial [Cytophagaceae bacterium]|nr:LPS-assembly protein LptD [Cytophagaceae bacterium]